MTAFFADLRFALRTWVRKPGAPLGAVLMLALGIGSRQILAQALRRTLALTLLGALTASRLIASMLYQLRPTDPATYATVVITFVAIAALAAWLPAHRALNADPAATLRAE